MHKKRSSQKHIPPNIKNRIRQAKFTPADFIVNSTAETLVMVLLICNYLSNTLHFQALWSIGSEQKSKKKTLQIKNSSFRDCHTDGLIMKAY